MLKLEAIYTQTKDRRWSATIADDDSITVYNAKDLPTAKVFIEMLVAEEYEFGKNKQRWEIITETIHHYQSDEGEEQVRELLNY